MSGREFDITMLDGGLYDRALDVLTEDEAEALAFATSELLDKDAIAAMICGRRAPEEVNDELRGMFRAWLAQYRPTRIVNKARSIAIMQERRAAHHAKPQR